MKMDVIEKLRHRAALSSAFSPSAPVSSLDLFSGRTSELERAEDAVLQRGRHVAIYGERGVGKTSLANVLPARLQYLAEINYQVVRHNCSSASTFNSMWEGVFRELSFKRNSDGFIEPSAPIPLSSYLQADAGPEDVRFLLQQTGISTVIIFDEFDRIPKDDATSGLLADTIKSLSDHAVNATLVIIGVADSIDDLIADHKSIERALVQIQMPRMSENELLWIIEKGFKQAEMEIEYEARCQIAALSQGLPHNVHELGLLTGLATLESGNLKANNSDVETAIKQAVRNAQQTTVASYCQAVDSPHENMYKEILLAAALAKTNDLGYFSTGDLRKPLAVITKRNYGIDAYMRHLNSFCEDSRGRVLEKTGEKRRYRFRFSQPIMAPYVIMRGIAEGLIKKEDVVEIETNNFKSTPLSLY
jgi:Cdc6-like AAA superfamily ATPase